MAKIEKPIKCCLCGGEIDAQRDKNGKVFWRYGHNAEPVKEGRCCSKCNNSKVIPARLKAIAQRRVVE